MSMQPSKYWSEQFTEILTAFLLEYQSGTYRKYWSYAKTICDHLGKDFLDMTASDISSYFDFLKGQTASTRLSPHSIACKKSFYSLLAAYIVDNYPDLEYRNFYYSIAAKDEEQIVHASSIPSLKEIDSFLAASMENPMHFLLYTMIFRMGLKTNEVLEIRYSDFQEDESGNIYLNLTGRRAGDYSSLISIPGDVKKILLRYMDGSTPVGKTNYLFTNRYRNQMTVTNLSKLTRKYCKNAQIDGSFTMQSLRSYAILNMINNRSKSSADSLDAIGEYAGLKYKRLHILNKAPVLTLPNPSDISGLKVIAP